MTNACKDFSQFKTNAKALRKINFHGQNEGEHERTCQINLFKYLKIAITYDQVDSPSFADFPRLITQSGRSTRNSAIFE